MNAKDLRAMTVEELRSKLAASREELFKMRFQHSTAQLANTASIPAVKKTIARLLTVLTEKGKE